MYLTNSGSEANDLAVMLARLHTGNFDVITFRYDLFLFKMEEQRNKPASMSSRWLIVEECSVLVVHALAEDRTMVAAHRALVSSPIKSINIPLPRV